jgi:hypothetical protein
MWYVFHGVILDCNSFPTFDDLGVGLISWLVNPLGINVAVKSVHVSHTKVVSYDLLSFPTKVVVGSAVVSLKEILHESDVVPDVSTSLAQPGHYVETI